MRIGVLTHNYPRFRGDFSGVFVEALCREFVAQGADVRVWTPDDAAWARTEWGGVEVRRYRYAPARWQQLGYMRSMQSDLALRLSNYLLSPGLFAAGILKVWQEARLWQPDVLHAHWLLPNGFIAAVVARLLHIPLVVSVPGSDAQVAAANPLFRAMARFVFAQADLLTANSEELRDAVRALGADPARFDLIIYGTNPATFQPDTTGVAQLRRTWMAQLNWQEENEPCFVLCVGRMVAKKGFDDLLRALADPLLRARPVVAIMVGEGDEKAAWQKLAAELQIADRVLWAGAVPSAQIGIWYNGADLLAMPSVSRPADGLNVCVLDAMACAKPVVASAVAGNLLAVVQGETGIIAPAQAPHALAQAIAILADNPQMRTYMGANGRARIERELGWRPLAERYLRHFQRLSSEKIATRGREDTRAQGTATAP